MPASRMNGFSRWVEAVADRINPRRVNERLSRSLMLAIVGDDLEGTKAALAAGADPAAKHPDWDWPLVKAARVASVDICQALVDAGAKVDQRCGRGFRALHAAIEGAGGQAEKVQLLLNAGACPNRLDAKDFAPLRMSIHHGGGLAPTRSLLAHGADPNEPGGDGFGLPLLAQAAMQDHAELAKLLVEAGASCERALAERGAPNQTWAWLSAHWEDAQLREQVAAPARKRVKSL